MKIEHYQWEDLNINTTFRKIKHGAVQVLLQENKVFHCRLLYAQTLEKFNPLNELQWPNRH